MLNEKKNLLYFVSFFIVSINFVMCSDCGLKKTCNNRNDKQETKKNIEINLNIHSFEREFCCCFSFLFNIFISFDTLGSDSFRLQFFM